MTSFRRCRWPLRILIAAQLGLLVFEPGLMAPTMGLTGAALGRVVALALVVGCYVVAQKGLRIAPWG